MPFDATGFAPRPLTETEQFDLAVLRFAREGVAAPYGWCKGSMGEGSRHCAMGWLLAGTTFYGRPDSYDDTCRIARHHLVPLIPRERSNYYGTDTAPRLVDFNDQGKRHKREVIALFDQAIAKLVNR